MDDLSHSMNSRHHHAYLIEFVIFARSGAILADQSSSVLQVLPLSQFRWVNERPFVFANELCISLEIYYANPTQTWDIFPISIICQIAFNFNRITVYIMYFIILCLCVSVIVNCCALHLIATYCDSSALRGEAMRIAAVVIVQNDQIWHWPYK